MWQRICGETCKRISKNLYKKRYLFLTIILILIILTLFVGLLKMLVILIILAIANWITSYAARAIPDYGTGIELIMLSTVISGLGFGSKVGAVFGFVSALLYYYGTGRFSYHVTVLAPLYACVGAIVPFFAQYPVFYIGVIASIIYTIVSSISVIIIFGAHLHKAIIFGIVNTFFNVIVFTYLAPVMMGLISYL